MAQLEPAAGELDRRITIRLREDFAVEDAGLKPTFSQARHRWAKIRSVGTAVYTDSMQTDDRITHRIWVRLLEGITTSHEVVAGTVIYRVKRSAPWGSGKRFTLIEVEELGQLKPSGGVYV